MHPAIAVSLIWCIPSILYIAGKVFLEYRKPQEWAERANQLESVIVGWGTEVNRLQQWQKSAERQIQDLMRVPPKPKTF